jgi:alpha-beta hydrolase superfamily lysophospholipase
MHARFFARADAPALLLLTGDADRTVPARAMLALRDATLAAGGSAEARVYEGVSHPSILQALARDRRDDTPVFQDVLAFAREVTAQPERTPAASR